MPLCNVAFKKKLSVKKMKIFPLEIFVNFCLIILTITTTKRVIVVCLEPRDLMVCPEKTVCQENLVEMERMVPRETLVCLVYLELLEERENQDWVELPDPRVTLDCRDQEVIDIYFCFGYLWTDFKVPTEL